MNVPLFGFYVNRYLYPCVVSQLRRQLTTSLIRMQDTRPPGHRNTSKQFNVSSKTRLNFVSTLFGAGNIVKKMLHADDMDFYRRQSRMDHLKLLNYDMVVDEEKVNALVHTSGLHYSDFDSKNGLPKPWQLMKLLESARFFSHHWPLDDTGRTFRDYAEVTSDRLTFLVTSRMDIERCLYDNKIPKCPLDISVQGGYIGSSSLNSIATAQTLQGQGLLSNINQVVSIDRSTRRPMPLPEWWRTKYAKVAEKFSSLKFERYPRPDSVVSYQVKVVRSDQDGNNHTNWSSYVRYSLDALYHNAKHGMMENFRDIDRRGLQTMELLYSGESFDDDLLDVYVWNKDDASFTACVHIEKANNIIFQGTYKYFDDPLF